MTVTRRHFLQVSSLAGGGFVLGVSLPALAAGPEDHAAALNHDLGC